VKAADRGAEPQLGALGERLERDRLLDGVRPLGKQPRARDAGKDAPVVRRRDEALAAPDPDVRVRGLEHLAVAVDQQRHDSDPARRPCGERVEQATVGPLVGPEAAR
jgi:hypothetical protein